MIWMISPNLQAEEEGLKEIIGLDNDTFYYPDYQD